MVCLGFKHGVAGLRHRRNRGAMVVFKPRLPSSIRRRDSNPRPLDQASSPITIRPGLSPYSNKVLQIKDMSF